MRLINRTDKTERVECRGKKVKVDLDLDKFTK